MELDRPTSTWSAGLTGAYMEIAYLADHPDFIPTLTRWHHHEWGYPGAPLVFPATLLSPGWQSNGDFAFDASGQPGQTYRIDVSTNLNSWSVLTNLTTTTFHTPASDPKASEYSLRSYRAVVR